MIDVFAKNAVTFAREFLQTADVAQLDLAAAVEDEAGGLDRPGGERNCCARNPQCLRQIVLFEFKDRAIVPVSTGQKPARKACFDSMTGIACRKLHAL